MVVLISNIQTSLIEDAIRETRADEVILIFKEPLEVFASVKFRQENINEESLQLENIIKDLLDADEDIQFALETDTTGVQILNAAKNFDQFKNITIYIVKNDNLEKFKACLC